MAQQLEDVMKALAALDSKTLASLIEDDLDTLESKLKSKADEAKVVRIRKINARIRHTSGSNN